MTEADLLIEIGSEELPADSQRSLSESLGKLLSTSLTNALLNFNDYQVFASPRRLAVLVKSINSEQPNRQILRKGPTLSRAYNANGEPTAAAIGFAKSCNTDIKSLSTIEEKGGQRLAYQYVQAGKSLTTLLPELLKQCIKQLPIKKRMRWGNHKDAFLRPVQWIVAIHGCETFHFDLFQHQSNNITYGHRIHAADPIALPSATNYQEVLEQKGFVIADFDARKQRIQALAKKIEQDTQLVIPIQQDLIEEVTGLVEWPTALVGTFDTKYLSLPKEVLLTVLQQQQRYFPMLKPDGTLSNKFLIIANLESLSPDVVIAGNEKVIHPRLSDANFFFETDKKRELTFYQQQLKTITFAQGLGTLHDKTHRIVRIACSLAEKLGMSVNDAKQAGQLLKIDLVTDMVIEFTNLQGIMGYYYALNHQQTDIIATAIKEHYQPKHAQDDVPASALGAILAIADKVDTIVGIIGLQQLPTGEKDPFALRRAAIGILRIIIHHQYNININELIYLAINCYQQQAVSFVTTTNQQDLIKTVFDFISSRYRSWYQSKQIMVDVIQAVSAVSPTNPFDFDLRVNALQTFKTQEDCQLLVTLNKRIHNILKKNSTINMNQTIKQKLLQEPAEQALVQQLNDITQKATDLFKQGNYFAGLKFLLQLELPINTFFDSVMVLVENQEIRLNRLAILNQLNVLLNQPADLTQIKH